MVCIGFAIVCGGAEHRQWKYRHSMRHALRVRWSASAWNARSPSVRGCDQSVDCLRAQHDKIHKRQLVNQTGFRNAKRCVGNRACQAQTSCSTSHCIQSVPSTPSHNSEIKGSNITAVYFNIGSWDRRTMPLPAPSRYVPKHQRQSNFVTSEIEQVNTPPQNDSSEIHSAITSLVQA